MKHQIIGNWSIRQFQTEKGGNGYHVFPAGERSHWSVRATLWPASDSKCYVISMNLYPTDARPSLDAALKYVIGILDAGLAKARAEGLQRSLARDVPQRQDAKTAAR